MNSFFFYLRRTEKSDFEKNEAKVLGMYIFAHSWGRPTARYLLKQALEPEILWISLQTFNSMFLKNYTFEIAKKKKIDFLKILDHHLPLSWFFSGCSLSSSCKLTVLNFFAGRRYRSLWYNSERHHSPERRSSSWSRSTGSFHSHSCKEYSSKANASYRSKRRTNCLFRFEENKTFANSQRNGDGSAITESSSLLGIRGWNSRSASSDDNQFTLSGDG